MEAAMYSFTTSWENLKESRVPGAIQRVAWVLYQRPSLNLLKNQVPKLLLTRQYKRYGQLTTAAFKTAPLSARPIRSQIIVNDKGQTEGVMLASGKVIKAKMVLSNATPKVTFRDLLEGPELPKEYINSIKNIDYTSPVTKINVAVNKLPNFLANPNVKDNEVMPHHRCTIHLNCENMDLLEDAYNDAKTKGIYSQKPMIELTIPSR